MKVVRFLAGDASLVVELRRRWTAVLTGGGGATLAARGPVRVTLGVPVALAELPPSPWVAIDIQWFAARDEALAGEDWLGAADAALCLASSLVGAGSCRVVAEEVVGRGQDHLDARWSDGGERLKMMSFGRRHASLSAEEFSARWRGEAGRLGGERMPDEVRGSAYVQNHPVRLDGGEWPFDAVNEVYVDGIDDLRRRAAWMAARPPAGRSGAAPLMSPDATWSLGVRESVLPSGDPSDLVS